jgi:hypothetical protein
MRYVSIWAWDWVANMRVATHAEARRIIAKDHLNVREVVRVRGGLRYNCLTKGKKKDRKVISIHVPAGAPEFNHPEA